MLSMTNAEQLVNVFMTSRQDSCNAIVGGCPVRLINKLQLAQNAAARVLTRTRKYCMTILAQFCQHCIGCLLNIVYIWIYCWLQMYTITVY